MIKLIVILFFLNSLGNNNFCNIERQLFEVKGNSMNPILKNGDNTILLKNYYKCNKAKKGDLIAYKYGNRLIVKQIKVTDKDNIYFSGHKLIVNNKILTNSQGNIYNFSDKEKNVIGMYIIDNKIPSNSFLIFGQNLTNSLDSRRFGAIGRKSIVGKFIRK